jgi:putative toxin-antitoxin system antitoxin component (TIGR02293 family)
MFANAILTEAFAEPPTELEVVELIERGLPLGSIEALKRQGLTYTEVHQLILPHRTLKHRDSRQMNLSSEETDRALRVAGILALADQVFGDHEKGMRWLRRESRQLDGRKPIEMLRSEVGGDVVRQMLYQIDEGIYV